MTTLLLRNLDDTRKLGLCISKVLRPGDILLLSGDLGAGKTTLTRFLARGLGIDEREVTSPTFNIIHEYLNGRLPVIHADIYRLGENAGILDTGIEDYLTGDFVLILEWAEFLPEPLTDENLQIDIKMQNDTRRATLKARGGNWKERLLKIENCFARKVSIQKWP